MKRYSFKTLVLLLAAFTFFSCNKDKDEDGYYVKLKINGNWVTWKTVAGELGPDFADASKTDLGVTANDDSGQDIFDITIQVNGTTFNTGSYSSDNTNYIVYVDYADNIGTTSARYYDITSAPSMPESKYTVNITSITDTELRGTFTGNYLYDYFEEETFAVTEGEFRVRRVR